MGGIGGNVSLTVIVWEGKGILQPKITSTRSFLTPISLFFAKPFLSFFFVYILYLN